MGGAVGIVAVVIVSRAPDPPGTDTVDAHRGLLEALGAGAGFGFFFVLLERSPSDSGIWPLVGTRVSMIALLGLLLVIAGTKVAVPTGMTAGVVGLGVLNISSDLLFLLATREGLLSVVAVLTALYPASTVLLARVVLTERLVRMQSLGLGVAGVSVVLIAAGS
jgi:drug/metabolite transporter (DMT)-like permease